MPEQKKGLPSIDTHDVPTLYANQANVTASFHDIRIFFSEASPKSVNPGAAGTPTELMITPRLSVVMSPEFARALRDALATSVGRYEEQFGKLREKPSKPTIEKQGKS